MADASQGGSIAGPELSLAPETERTLWRAGLLSAWEVAPDVAGLTQGFVNLFSVGPRGAPDRGWVLVDAGMPLSAPSIRLAAARRFGERSRPAAILLTHGHFDHIGGLPDLAREWDAPIYCHPMEMPYVTGRSPYPPPDASLPGGMSFLSRLYPRGPFDFTPHVRELPGDGTVPGMDGWRWIATPGHSPGHVSFFRESDRLLLVGDAFVTTAQEYAASALSQAPRRVFGPPAYFTPDWHAADESVRRLADLRPNVAATGHGRPMSGAELREGLTALIERWHDDVVPRDGRYGRMPAVCDSGGFVSAPPARFDPRVPILAGGLLLGVLATLSLSRRGR